MPAHVHTVRKSDKILCTLSQMQATDAHVAYPHSGNGIILGLAAHKQTHAILKDAANDKLPLHFVSMCLLTTSLKGQSVSPC